jgi:CRP/FNR family transcriptional regulator
MSRLIMPIPVAELQRQPLLRQVDRPVLDLMAVEMQTRSYKAGQLVSLEGDACAEVCFVAQGLLRQRHLTEEGRQHVIGYLGPGAVYNLIPALDGGTYLATVDALTAASINCLPCERLTELMAEHPQLSYAVSRQLAREARRLGEMAKGLALYKVRTRLARFLLDHAEVAPPQRRWTQDTIAAHIATVRDVVGRILRDMMEEGIIRRERGRLVVVNREALEREASGS